MEWRGGEWRGRGEFCVAVRASMGEVYEVGSC